MFRKLKYEFSSVKDNIALIGLAAFFCCMGGILLWVSGGSTWYIMNILHKPEYSLSLSGVFIAWLIVYGLLGTSLALVWIISRGGGSVKICLATFGLISMSYLLCLTWYTAFCCTRLSVFAAILLIIAAVMNIASAVIMRKASIILTAVTVLSVAA